MAGFSGFGDRDDMGVPPYGRYGGSIEGKVEEVGQVVYAPRAQMFKVPNGEAIWAHSRRVSTPSYGLKDHFRGEGAGLGA